MSSEIVESQTREILARTDGLRNYWPAAHDEWEPETSVCDYCHRPTHFDDLDTDGEAVWCPACRRFRFEERAEETRHNGGPDWSRVRPGYDECPFCGDEACTDYVRTRAMDGDAKTLMLKVRCSTCRSEWHEVAILDGVTQ